MLPVGREINIKTRKLRCRGCSWEGCAADLATGLIKITDGAIYLYAYRCSVCGSFDVAVNGKLLAFRPRQPATHQLSLDNETEDLTTEETNHRWR
jgi:predicted Rdx family selenoprotein